MLTNQLVYCLIAYSLTVISCVTVLSGKLIGCEFYTAIFATPFVMPDASESCI